MQTIKDIAHKRIWASQENKSGIGTFTGVFLPSFITMIGALLFLNLGKIVGSSSLGMVISTLILALVITMITALSVTSMASNTRIGKGGMYYMLSRCFGYEVGAAAGIALYIAHTLAACLCIMGLSSTIVTFTPDIDLHLIRFALLAIVTLTAFTSTKLALRMQVIVFALIIGSLTLLIIGPYSAPQTTGAAETFSREFWYVFSLIYPALIGIEAGAAMSSELKRPRFSLIFGTLTVTIIGFFFYLTLTIKLWTTVPRVTLLTTPDVLAYLSPLGPLALVGLFAATLFSAMGCLLTAPKTLSAMAEDRLFPAPLRNSRVATLLTATFVAIGILTGSMGGVVPILTKVILIVYGMLNLAVAVENLIDSPTWRPAVYVWPAVPAFGALICFFSMFMMNAGEAFFACGLLLLIAYLVKRWKVVSKWNDMKQAILFSLGRFAIYKLYNMGHTQRSWRPNFLVLSESASLKTPLLSVAYTMSAGHGFITMASVLKKGNAQLEDLNKWERVIRSNLKKRRVNALVEVTIANNLVEGLKNIITNFGVRPLTPNTVVLGESIRQDHYQNYLELIRIASEAQRNVLVVRGEMMKDEIDIWYDPKEKKSCELMIILAHGLKKSKNLRNSKIIMKCLVKNEVEKEKKLDYFEKYFNENRLSMKVKVYIEDEEPLMIMNKESTKKGIVFVAMKNPDESLSYYYKTMMQGLKDIPTLCLTLCREDIQLQ